MSNSPRKRQTRSKPIIHAIQVYDLNKLGYPLAVFEGVGQFQDITKGDTMDGRCWPSINGHSNYARIYRVVSIRHTLSTQQDGSVKHLKSIFVEPALAPRSDRNDGQAEQGAAANP